MIEAAAAAAGNNLTTLRAQSNPIQSSFFLELGWLASERNETFRFVSLRWGCSFHQAGATTY